jgi:hypothetical protein
MLFCLNIYRQALFNGLYTQLWHMLYPHFQLNHLSWTLLLGANHAAYRFPFSLFAFSVFVEALIISIARPLSRWQHCAHCPVLPLFGQGITPGIGYFYAAPGVLLLVI